MGKGRPNYFETFEPTRVKLGEVVTRHELVRRLAHFLQVPQRFGNRLLSAFESTLLDALVHGEGIRIPGVGVLKIRRHTKDTHKGFGRTMHRKRLYYFSFEPGDDGLKFLEDISDLERQGKLGDYLQKD